MSNDSFQEKLNYHLLDSFVKQTSMVISGHLVVALMNMGLFWDQIDHGFMLSWAVFLLLVVLSRWFMKVQYQRRQERLSPGHWRGLFVVSSLLLGLVWLVWCLYVSMAIEFRGIGLSILVITAAGLAAGAVASTSSSIHSFVCFTSLILLPLSVMLLLKDDFRIQGIGLLMAVFFLTTLRQVLSIHSVLRESIINRLELEKSKEQTEKLASELYKISTLDALTSITNRRGFDEALGREWPRARRSEQPLTLLMIDVDYFKPYNDRLGHLAGDDCLRLIASTLSDLVRRAGDTLARYGGEEFAVLLPDTTAAQGVEVAENICAGIAKLNIPHPDSAIAQRITVSIGVCGAVPDQLADSEELIKRADQALYQAKAGGRNCVRWAALPGVQTPPVSMGGA